MTANGTSSERQRRLRQLLNKFHHDTLSLHEARELLELVDGDLRRARGEGNRRMERIIRRYKRGIESYIALSEDDRVLASS